MAEKSVLTNPGPYTGARAAVPSSPSGGSTKAHGLNQNVLVCTWAGAAQVGLAGDGTTFVGITHLVSPVQAECSVK